MKENNELQKAIFKYIIKNDDLSKYKANTSYFDNETISDCFKAIVKHYKAYKTIINNSDELYIALENKHSKDAIELVLNCDISNYSDDYLCDKTTEYINKLELRTIIKNTMDILRDGSKEEIKNLTDKFGISNSLFEVKEESIKPFETPLISDTIYNNIPTLLNDITSHFESREKDIVFLSSLSVISILFDNVFIRWKTEKDKPNLLLFIGAKASAGKSKMKYSRMLLNKFLNEENENNKLIKINAEQNNFNEKPIYKHTLIPANSSSAAFEQKLYFNGGKGLIFTEEASEIGMNKKQDWGNYDAMLRKAFHNETIASNRKDNDILYINNSYVSCSISGTYDQLLQMFEDKDQNGLFSRFAFYLFDSESKWLRDNGLRYTYNKENDLDNVFNNYSETIYKIFEYYKEREIEIDLTPEQSNLFDNVFERLDNEYFVQFGDRIKPSVNRIAVIARKILMLLTLIRNYESNINDNEFSCLDAVFDSKIMISDIDLDNVLKIADMLLKHTSVVFNSFFYNEMKKEVVIKQDYKMDLFNSMNKDFTFGEMKEKGLKDYDISYQTVNRFIKDLMKRNIIQQLKKGHYRKI